MAIGTTQSVGLDRVDAAHWSYSGDPRTSGKDHVRFLIGDVVQDDRLVSDAEILAALADEGSVRRAAAQCCEFLSGLFSREADRTTEGNTLSLSQRAKAFAERAESLRALATESLSRLAMPFAGGISRSSKEQVAADPDRTAPFFTRDGDDNAGAN